MGRALPLGLQMLDVSRSTHPSAGWTRTWEPLGYGRLDGSTAAGRHRSRGHVCGRETRTGKGAVDLSQGPRHTQAEGGGPGPPAAGAAGPELWRGPRPSARGRAPEATGYSRLGPAAEPPQPLRRFHFTPGRAICPLGMESTLEAAPPSCPRHQHPLARRAGPSLASGTSGQVCPKGTLSSKPLTASLRPLERWLWMSLLLLHPSLPWAHLREVFRFPYLSGIWKGKCREKETRVFLEPPPFSNLVSGYNPMNTRFTEFW